MTVTRDGTVDFLDDGNCRIRAISPDGVIRTILRVPLVKVYPSGTACPVYGLRGLSGWSALYRDQLEVERVSSARSSRLGRWAQRLGG